MRIDDITIGERSRKDLGDVTGLARSIDDIGLLHPVVVNLDGLLIAGQRRIAAARMLGWETISATILDLEAIAKGEHDENVYRKAFLPSEAVAIAKAIRPIEEKNAKDRQLAALTGSVDSTERGDTRDRTAAAIGMGWQKLQRAEEVVDSGDEDLIEKMDERETVTAAWRELKRRRAQAAPPLPSDKYRVIYADPPWQYGNTMPEISFGEQADHYPVMTPREISALSIKEIAADNAVLFLWATSPILEEAFEVVNAWGFKYKAAFVWDKVQHVMGHYNSVRHELLLICVRGSCQPDKKQLFDSVISIERTKKHSEKPERFREIIDTLYPWGKRIELFSRREVDAWDRWGNE